MNDNRTIDRAAIEVLSSSLETVTPRPLPVVLGELAAPLLPPADWTASIELTTAWRTDITRASSPLLDQEEAISLQTRPARTLTCRFTSRESQEAHTVAQALIGFALAGGPVLLYQDQVRVEDSVDEGPNTRIYGNFTFGHFYVGQRVVIAQRKPVKNYWEDTSIRTTILETSSASLVVVGEMPRDLTLEDLVYPCIDADIVPSSTGVFVTDSILRVELTFEETSGPETLPASYPPMAWGSLGDMVALADDGTPLLDLPLDWTDGVSVAVNRRVSSQPTGRAVASSAFGGPYFSFGLSFLSPDRRRAWDILRFFDACRGRAGLFSFLHPNQPWQFFAAPGSGSSTVDIRAVGTRFDLEKGFRRVALFDSAGRVYLRRIVSVESLSAQRAFRLTLSAPVPADVVDLAPAHMVRLSSDALRQEWLSDGVSRSSLDLEEVLDPSPAAPPGGAARVRFDSHRNRHAISLLEPRIWVCPAVNAYAAAGALLLRSAVDPGSPSQCARFFDAREGLPDSLRADTPTQRSFLWARQRNGVLTQLSPSRRVGGKPCVVFCQYALSDFEQAPGGPPLPLAQQPLWSNEAGWTLIFNTCPKDTSIFGAVPSPTLPGQVSLELLRIVHNGVNALVLTQSSGGSQLSVFNVSTGSVVATNLSVVGIANADSSAHTFTFVLRFDPLLGRLYCHVNGFNAISSPGYVSVGSLLTAFPAQAYIGAYFNYPSPVMEPHLAFTVGSLNCLMSWDRALAVEDVDIVGRDVSEAFASPWQTPAYP